jgi:lysophospholipase L1-like esterase
MVVFDDRAQRCEIWSREAAHDDGTHPKSGGYSKLAAIIAIIVASVSGAD